MLAVKTPLDCDTRSANCFYSITAPDSHARPRDALHAQLAVLLAPLAVTVQLVASPVVCIRVSARLTGLGIQDHLVVGNRPVVAHDANR